jgi:hypothetical protein
MKNFALLSSVMILFITSLIYSQVTLQVGAGGGYISPTGDYAGSTVDFYNGTKYGMSSGYNFNGKVRVGLLGFDLFGMIEYSSISGDGQSDPDNKNSQIKNTQNIFSIKAGPEFKIEFPLSPIGIYFDGFLSVNTFSGTVSFQGVSGVASGDYDLGTTTRVGAGGGGGVLLDFIPVVTLDFGIHYNWYNLFGKQYTAYVNTNPGANYNTPRLNAYTSLNDDADPLYQSGSDDNIIGESRSINAWEFTLTAMIGI